MANYAGQVPGPSAVALAERAARSSLDVARKDTSELAPTSARGGARSVRLRSIVDGHFDSVWRALKRLGVPEAGVDDAAQQVFIVAARRLDEVHAGREREYLLGIALRVASDARRAVTRRREVPIEEAEASIPEIGPSPDEVLDEKRAREALAAILDRLPGDLREAFVLFELEEISAPRVAELLGVPVGTVASRVRRARGIITQILARRRGAR